MLNAQQIQTIYSLYPQVITVYDDIAYDKNKNEISYDLQAVLLKTQAKVDAKASALAKLTALGLSEDEVKALVG